MITINYVLIISVMLSMYVVSEGGGAYVSSLFSRKTCIMPAFVKYFFLPAKKILFQRHHTFTTQYFESRKHHDHGHDERVAMG